MVVERATWQKERADHILGREANWAIAAEGTMEKRAYWSWKSGMRGRGRKKGLDCLARPYSIDPVFCDMGPENTLLRWLKSLLVWILWKNAGRKALIFLDDKYFLLDVTLRCYIFKIYVILIFDLKLFQGMCQDCDGWWRGMTTRFFSIYSLNFYVNGCNRAVSNGESMSVFIFYVIYE